MYVKLMERDRKRFTAADMNGDGKLSKQGEFNKIFAQLFNRLL
jgi:hypothetical protein